MLDKVVPQPRKHPLTELQKTHVLEHYHRAAPLLAIDFPNMPIVASWHDDGLGKPASFSGGWQHLPESISHVAVTTPSGLHLYPGCTENAVLWLVHQGAVGILSWTPAPGDPESVGYARILLKRCGKAGEAELKYALLALRTALTEIGLEAIPVLDGHEGAALFVPFGDTPLYEDVRAWLHRFCAKAAEKHPALLTCAKPDEAGDRVHLAVSSNAVGRHSELPYALAGNLGLHMVTPVEWNELGEVDNGTYTARTSAKRLERDMFAVMTVAIGVQRFSSVR